MSYMHTIDALASLPAPPPSLTLPCSASSSSKVLFRARVPVQLTIITDFEARAAAAVLPTRGHLGPKAGTLPRRRATKKKTFIVEEPTPTPKPLPPVDAGSCLQPIIDGLYVAFAGERDALTHHTDILHNALPMPKFTHVLSILPDHALPVSEHVDAAGVHRLHLRAPNSNNCAGTDGLTREQLRAAREWIVGALGGRVPSGFMGLEDAVAQDAVHARREKNVLVSTSGLRPGDAMSVVTAYLTSCARKSASTPSRVIDAETAIRYIDEDENMMSWWQATVCWDELQLLLTLDAE